MKKHLIVFLTNPGTLTSLLMLGTLAFIGAAHNHAHHTMEVDADSYVLKWCSKHPKKCTYNRDY